jgi:hypothetical protein
VLDGAALAHGRQLERWSCVHLEPAEAGVRLTGGPDGYTVLVLDFPRPRPEEGGRVGMSEEANEGV